MRRPLLTGLIFLALATVDWAAAGWGTAGGWVDQYQAGPFACRSEFPLKEIQKTLEDLHVLQEEIEETLGVKANDRAIEVLLFKSRGNYVRYVGQRVPEGTKRQALYVQGPDVAWVYAYRSRELSTDVCHEATHAILHNALPYVPLWLDEGLAEYFEVPRGMRANGNPYRSSVKSAIRWGWKPNFADLESKREVLDMDAKDYRDSWACVHFMLHGPPEARKALMTYLHEVNSGKAPTPLVERLRSHFPDLERRIVDHFR